MKDDGGVFVALGIFFIVLISMLLGVAMGRGSVPEPKPQSVCDIYCVFDNVARK